ncbi:MAG: ribulose-phosphate 3-epimerase [Clostridia bacterium]|nr:ribulose-phosphate 3-epimerase [Clostridia bacterium]
MRKIKIAPSILSANFAKMGEEVEYLEKCGADLIHCDVMDGTFVNPITFGAQMVKEIRKITKLPLDVHLMITHPQSQIVNFAEAGADIVLVHYEACNFTAGYRTQEECIDDIISMIHRHGMKAGLVINPDTSTSVLRPYVTLADQILLMSVVPGYGGKTFIPETLDKIRLVRQYADAIGKEIDIEVDGGITEENVDSVIRAGANVIVAGSTIFKSEDKARTIRRLRGEV